MLCLKSSRIVTVLVHTFQPALATVAIACSSRQRRRAVGAPRTLICWTQNPCSVEYHSS